MNINCDMKICVAGVGAIGTIMATMIGQKYAKNLSVLARNKRLEEIRKNVLYYTVNFMEKRKHFLQMLQIMGKILEFKIISWFVLKTIHLILS